MSDTGDTRDSQSEERLDELQEQFDAWRKDSIVPPGFAEEERSIEDRLQDALKVLAIRRISLVILVTLAAMGLSQSWSDFAYFFTSSEPVEVGDIRKAYLADDPLPVLEHNSFVAIDSLIPTSVFDSPSHRFFFCPLYNIIVQTQQDIPAKQAHKSYFEIEAGEGRILEEKLAFIWDLPIRMDMTGRLMDVNALGPIQSHLESVSARGGFPTRQTDFCPSRRGDPGRVSVVPDGLSTRIWGDRVFGLRVHSGKKAGAGSSQTGGTSAVERYGFNPSRMRVLCSRYQGCPGNKRNAREASLRASSTWFFAA